jgi:hypothetical protein
MDGSPVTLPSAKNLSSAQHGVETVSSSSKHKQVFHGRDENITR